MLCGLGSAIGIVLDGGPAVLRDVAVATNFGTHFAITSFVGYNFVTHCLILGMGFRIRVSEEDIAKIECLRVVDMATSFWNKVAINWLCVNDSD